MCVCVSMWGDIEGEESSQCSRTPGGIVSNLSVALCPNEKDFERCEIATSQILCKRNDMAAKLSVLGLQLQMSLRDSGVLLRFKLQHREGWGTSPCLPFSPHAREADFAC